MIVDGYFQENPTPKPQPDAGAHGHLMSYLDGHALSTKLHRWRLISPTAPPARSGSTTARSSSA